MYSSSPRRSWRALLQKISTSDRTSWRLRSPSPMPRRSSRSRHGHPVPRCAAVVGMAVAMEAAKLVTVGWLARRWRVTAWILRTVSLAVINATGVYASLSPPMSARGERLHRPWKRRTRPWPPGSRWRPVLGGERGKDRRADRRAPEREPGIGPLLNLLLQCSTGAPFARVADRPVRLRQETERPTMLAGELEWSGCSEGVGLEA